MDTKRYIREILRLVKVDRKTKHRLREDLEQDIEARLASGETLADVIRDMGEPFAVAAAIQEDHEPVRARTIPESVLLGSGLVFLALSGATLALRLIDTAATSVITLFLRLISGEPTVASIGIIGGADGPTAIYTTATISPVGRVLFMVVLAAILLGVYTLLRKRGKR